MTDQTPKTTDPLTPYVAIGNDEMGGPIGAAVKCPHCGQQHPVEYGEKVLPDGSRERSNALGFYRCGEKSYLCALYGRDVMKRFEKREPLL